MPILQVVNVTKYFGGLRALYNCSLDIHKSEILGLIGPNGSGKTTLFNIIVNLYRPDSGYILFKGKKIEGLRPYHVAKLGIGRTFQGVKTFSNLTVIENMIIAGMVRKTELTTERAYELLTTFGFEYLANEYSKNLSFGQQRLLELAMSLMPDPEFLMLDEPAAGVHPVIRNRILELIKSMKAKGKTFLVIEHNIDFVAKCSDRVVVLNQGQKLAEGPPKIVWENPDVIRAYLGRSRADA
jgi:ABC-type branched-subunit amino acid transport system ATPase component